MTERDAVDRIVAQWAVERPDLDSSPMAVVGRIHRVADLLDSALRPPFAEEGLGNGDFDVLASLRRAGAPYRLTPSELTATMMVTSGAVTKRIDRLHENLGALKVHLGPADVARIGETVPTGAAAGLRYPEAQLKGVYI